jgi:hypothetical protein
MAGYVNPGSPYDPEDIFFFSPSFLLLTPRPDSHCHGRLLRSGPLGRTPACRKGRQRRNCRAQRAKADKGRGACQGRQPSVGQTSSAFAPSSCSVVLLLTQLNQQEGALDATAQRFHYISADLTSSSEAARVVDETTLWNSGSPPDIVSEFQPGRLCYSNVSQC